MNDAAPTWHPAPSPSKITLPKGATDTHCHVFGPTSKFPFAPESKFKPGDAPKEQLFALHDAMGIERCVIVQSGCHGYNNDVVADAIAARPHTYLGVALSHPEVERIDIQRLTSQGFVGLRFNYMGHLKPGATHDQLRTLAPMLADLGWHLQIHMDAELIGEMAPVLSNLPVDVVIDHMGRIDATLGLKQSNFSALQKLIECPNMWVKVSGIDRASQLGAPYVDAIPLARQLVEKFPEQVLWGTDWPHPNHHAGPPDDGALINTIPQIAQTPALIQALMVDNPTKLYGFDSKRTAK